MLEFSFIELCIIFTEKKNMGNRSKNDRSNAFVFVSFLDRLLTNRTCHKQFLQPDGGNPIYFKSLEI